MTANGYQISWGGGEKNILELDGDDHCTTL